MELSVMELTFTQHDALTELINIGYGRAASALSELTGHRVTLEVPRITVHPMEQVAPLVAQLVSGEVTSVSQAFSGAVAGHAYMMMDNKSALVLSRLLSDDPSLLGSFDASRREIITEVGNIVLNACLGVFGNLLQMQVTFAVPRLQVTEIGEVLQSMATESGELHYGLLIHTHFYLRDSAVTGYLIIILGVTSLERMLREVDDWELRQTTR